MAKKNEKLRTIAYWVTTILGPTSFVIGGTMFLMRHEQPVTNISHLGYPIYMLSILGVFKILGAIVITLPKLPLLKEWAYAGFAIDLIGGAASHAFSGDPFFSGQGAQIASPLIFLALVVVSWALRPASRRLPGTELFKSD